MSHMEWKIVAGMFGFAALIGWTCAVLALWELRRVEVALCVMEKKYWALKAPIQECVRREAEYRAEDESALKAEKE